MARLESVAVGGYYPTPPHLIERIARMLDGSHAKNADHGSLVLLDPCAGDGAAVVDLASAIVRKDGDAALSSSDRCRFYAIEMEKTRHAALKVKLAETKCGADDMRGDAFRALVERNHMGGASILYLNPPYDLDRVHGRLEQRFLDRFGDSLAPKGVLVFVVPHYALAASADQLAREFCDITCFRFPDPDFETYKQVVLYAVRRDEPLLAPDEAVVEGVRLWASNATTLPVLPADDAGMEAIGAGPLRVPLMGPRPFKVWTMQKVDLIALLPKVRPWVQTARGGVHNPIESVRPSLPPTELMQRIYPLAVPPRPAHIAAGMASGIFNGARVEPDPPPEPTATTKKGAARLGAQTPRTLPPLLVKGVFDREYKTIEEKHNKDGDVTGLVQVQQPKMVVTVLDLTTYRYHTLQPGSETRNPADVTVETMSVADLLDNYATSLMGVMEKQCPVLYDPRYDSESVTLHPSPRTLFTAQAHAARACVRLLQDDKTPVLLGEIGSGKSTVSAVAARTVGAKHILVLCPPHLLAGWTEQVEAIAPDMDVHILKDVDDLWALKARVDRGDKKPFVALLSRETAKLGHAWHGLTAGSACPACGGTVREGDHAKSRSRCDISVRVPLNDFGQWVIDLARLLQPHVPTQPNVRALLPSRADQRRAARYIRRLGGEGAKRDGRHWMGIPSDFVDRIVKGLLARLTDEQAEGYGLDTTKTETALAKLLLAAYDPARIARVVTALTPHLGDYGHATALATELCLLLPPGSPEQTALLEPIKAASKRERLSQYYDPWKGVEDTIATLGTGGVISQYGGYRLPNLKHENGIAQDGDGNVRGSVGATLTALASLVPLCRFKASRVCDEPLYQAIAEPTARLPLASVICKHHPRLFDFLICDEGHEYATDGSAQERAAHRLTGLGIPTLLMTGTIMNGYAESLFSNFWAISRPFRKEFDRDQRSVFVERYGYRKVLLEEKENKKAITYGSVTDRVEGNRKVIGHAPGVMPLFLLRHLLPVAVTLHKADLAIDLPACTQEPVQVRADELVMQQYNRLKDALLGAIKRDLFSERAGALWGQLSELPSYLDRATMDTGNGHDRAYVIRYPQDTPKVGGHVVATVPLLPPTHILEKERWMLDQVAAEIKAGRNVLVFGWHIPVLPRLARLISERTGQKVPILHADKVPTGKRQDWINKEVVGKKARVMVANPVTVQTGLNNLVHFHTEVWMENPACNPLVFRQAIGRVDRIGQKKPTRILVPVYEDTMQVQTQDLLMRKVAVSVATDGLDPEAALQAAGVAEDSYLAGLSIGKQLYSMLTDEALGGAARPPKRTAPPRDDDRSVLRIA